MIGEGDDGDWRGLDAGERIELALQWQAEIELELAELDELFDELAAMEKEIEQSAR